MATTKVTGRTVTRRKATKRKTMKSFRDRDPIKVGIASIVVIALLVVGAAVAGASRLITPGYPMAGVFEEAGEVQPGQPVILSGLTVGSVTDVEPDFGKGTVVVRWQMNDGIELNQKARASIALMTPIGGRVLRLSGPAGGPHMSALPEEHRVIPIERTSTPVTINEILDEVVRLAEDLDEEAIADLLEQVIGITEENKEELRKLLSVAGQLAKEIGDNAPQLQKILDQGGRVAELVERKDEELLHLVRAASTISDALLTRRDQLRAVFGTGNRAVREMSSLLKRNRKQIEGALIDLGESWDATWEVLPEWHAVWSWLNPVAEAAKPIVENPAGYLYGAHALGVNSIEGMLMPLERLRDMAPGGSPQGGN